MRYGRRRGGIPREATWKEAMSRDEQEGHVPVVVTRVVTSTAQSAAPSVRRIGRKGAAWGLSAHCSNGSSMLTRESNKVPGGCGPTSSRARAHTRSTVQRTRARGMPKRARAPNGRLRSAYRATTRDTPTGQTHQLVKHANWSNTPTGQTRRRWRRRRRRWSSPSSSRSAPPPPLSTAPLGSV